MHKLIEILTDYQPIFLLILGAFIPYIEKKLERLARSKQYKIASEVYQAIDPKFIDKLGGRFEFVNLIQEAIKATSDKKLTTKEIDSLTRLVIKNFQLNKAIGKVKKQS